MAGDAEILGFSTPNLGFRAVGLSGLDDETRRVIVERTERSPGAFRELVRQAVLRAAIDERPAPQGADLVAALDELLDDRTTLTRRLPGQPGDGDGPPSPPFGSMVHALGAAGLPMPDVYDLEE